jgi:hypothetical protein
MSYPLICVDSSITIQFSDVISASLTPRDVRQPRRDLPSAGRYLPLLGVPVLVSVEFLAHLEA